jgi:hypothetical protein
MLSIIPSSLVKIRSNILGLFSPLNLVGCFTFWIRNESITLSKNVVAIWSLPTEVFCECIYTEVTLKVFTARGCVIYTEVTLKAYYIESRVMDYTEHLQIGIKTTDGPNLLVSCIYRSPSANNDACVGELSETSV